MRTSIKPNTISVSVRLNDGSVVYLTFVTLGEFATGTVARAPTPANIQAEIARQPYAAQVASWRVIDRADVKDDPLTRRYRAALRDTGAFTFDMPVARELHREYIRRAREPLLTALDADYLRADEQNAVQEKARIAAAKQVLRDLPAAPAIEAAQTLEELEAAWPRVLE